MARPFLCWSQRLAGCYLLICMFNAMTWIVLTEDLVQSPADLASCEELQCAHDNVCHMSSINGTQIGHARCLCRGQWAGRRCLAQIQAHVATSSPESVIIGVKGHGPPHWDIEYQVDELLIKNLSITFWNMNRSEDCNVLITSQPKSRLQVEGLEKGQEYLFCVGNGPSDLCSVASYSSDISELSRRPNCVHVRTKLNEDVPLDIGLILVPVASLVFIIFICIFFYCKRHSLCVHFILHVCCCRACYCCRKRCLRRKLQHMRKQQMKQKQQQDSLGNLLRRDTSVDPTLDFDLCVASTSVSSSAMGNRSSVISGSYRSAKSVDSDVTMPPAYPDESSVFYQPDAEAYVPYENVPIMKRRISETSFPNFNTESNHFDFLFPKEPFTHQDKTSIPLRHGYSFKGPGNNVEQRICQDNNYSQFPVYSKETSYQPWVATDFRTLPPTVSFPMKSRTLPSKTRHFPQFNKSGYPLTIVGNGQNSYEPYFRPTPLTIQDDADNLSLQNVPFDTSDHQKYLNLPYSTATFPRRKRKDISGSSTLPRAHSRKRDAQLSSAIEYPSKMPEMFYPYSGSTKKMAFESLTLPPCFSDVPETALPSKDSDEIKSLPSKDSDEIKSTDSKEDTVSRKRVKSLIGHFERSLPFFKPSSNARPNSVHWEDEVNDYTSPLALERSKGSKKKRPRPWSLPADFDSRPILRRSLKRSQKPVFDEHPSLHVLPPFTTDEEEEDEVMEAIKAKANKNDALSNDVKNDNHNVEKANASTPCLKKDQYVDNNFISSYGDDDRNLVTPFICEESEDEDEDMNDGVSNNDMTVKLNGDMS